ncbi:LuxR family transcriptional regulator [Streptomyces sp. SID10853]|uniref:helix-turn-helix transcriptional regulator n=1 Tax=Streptomyces sp. SID10853 TaxID=2706028 RepID=UPI0013C19F70|nr:LuxR C-terminal-related transcriptional regulator [Streptomyces sp. SID10853]NDZ81342.1 LuxR family transcriptional regulator [Streptomyces sp. SID10853]
MGQQQTGDNVFATGNSLNAEEVAVYRWFALHRHLDLPRVAAETGLGEATVHQALESLLRIGLVQPDKEDPDRVWAVDPHLVAAVATAPLERTIAEQQNRLRVFRDQFARLASDYEEGKQGASAELETIPGLSQVRAALNRASEQCREDMITVQPGGTRSPEVLQDALARDSELLARGVRMRTLYHHTARFNGPSQAYVATASALGAEYRTAHQLFGRMIIFDRKAAFLPDHHGTLGAVVVREPSVVHFLCELFEQVWSQAKPFSDAANDGLEAVAKDLDRTILQLLATGLKDETVARRLGMSLRTTRKHIADIMQKLGADSRFQAGVAVAIGGLLDDDTDLSTPPTPQV